MSIQADSLETLEVCLSVVLTAAAFFPVVLHTAIKNPDANAHSEVLLLFVIKT